MRRKRSSKKENKGITLIALVVTIVVLLVLASISINMTIGENGIVTRAQQARITTELDSYKEQLNLYKTAKKAENDSFYEESLMAGKNSIYYNTKISNEENSIKDIIKNISDEYLDKVEVVKGKLTINTQDKKLIKIAQNMEIEPNPYVINNGELESNDGNLLLVDDTGTLTLPSSVTKIGEGAFANVEGLKTIIIPGSVKTIGKGAFRNNATLEKVVIEEGVEVIEESAFNACSNLKEVTLPESLKRMDNYVFTSCKSLNSIEIPSNIENLNTMLFSMSGLANIKLRGNKIKRIEHEVFFGCKIKEFTITKDVNYIDPTAFDHCTQLELTMDTNNTNYIYNNGILMPSTKESVLFVSNNYYKDKTKFEIPQGVITFTCNLTELTNITTLIIPASTTTLNARNLPYSLTNVQIDDANTKFKTAENCIYTKTTPETLIFCYSKASEIKLTESAAVIEQFAFRGSQNATKITFNDNTTTLKNQIFSDCYILKDVIIGKNVSEINSMIICGMYNVNLIIDKDNPYYVMQDDVLYNKNKDTLITVQHQITGKFDVIDSVKKIKVQAFYGQSKMTEINLNKIEEIENSVFNGCSGLTSLEIPETIKSINISAFNGTYTIKKIIIHRKENSIAGSPFGSPLGTRAIVWDDNN